MLPTQFHYFDLYTLDFSHVREFAEQVESQNDELKKPFQEACSGASLRSTLQKNHKQFELLTSAFPDSLTNPKEPVYEFVSQLKTAANLTQELLDQFQGANPYDIQDLVHQVLGFYNDIPLATRQHYLELMKNTGFLITDIRSLPAPHPIRDLTTRYLEAHPQTAQFGLGCGKAAFTGPACCHFRRADDHAAESFTIALDATVGPDITVDMHDPELWAGIPNERFAAILDHSYGYFLFEDERSAETLQQLFRALKPGGYLKMDFVCGEKQVEMLVQAGFNVEVDSKIARKP